MDEEANMDEFTRLKKMSARQVSARCRKYFQQDQPPSQQQLRISAAMPAYSPPFSSTSRSFKGEC
jgi:hypothetical protein